MSNVRELKDSIDSLDRLWAKKLIEPGDLTIERNLLSDCFTGLVKVLERHEKTLDRHEQLIAETRAIETED